MDLVNSSKGSPARYVLTAWMDVWNRSLPGPFSNCSASINSFSVSGNRAEVFCAGRSRNCCKSLRISRNQRQCGFTYLLNYGHQIMSLIIRLDFNIKKQKETVVLCAFQLTPLSEQRLADGLLFHHIFILNIWRKLSDWNSRWLDWLTTHLFY